jgi:sugar lactone lactonase YvrE
MAVDASGNVYFVDGYGYQRAAARSHSVFKIDPSGLITRIAGNSRTGFSGDGGPALSASLYSPLAVAVDNAGNVFIVDAGNQRVRRVSPDGKITTVAGGGSAVLGDGGRAIDGQLNYPGSIAVDGAGDLFIGELGRVRKVTREGIITTVAGGGPNSPGDGGPATSAQLTRVIGVGVDGAGNLFIGDENYDDVDDTYGYSIRKVSPSGIIATLPPVPICCYGALAVDSAGNLFVPAGAAVWKVSPSGSQTIVAGNGTYGTSSTMGDGGPATQAQLTLPTAVAADPAGGLIIADNVGRNVRRVTSDGIIRTLASIASSELPPSGDGRPAISAQLQLAVPGLSYQSGLTADTAGNLYIAETAAHRVRKVSPDGTITTVAGVGTPRCSAASTCAPLGDGEPATKAALSYPTSVAVDAAGNLFIADSGNLRVRKVSADGMITTVAGNGSPALYPYQLGADNGGPATNAPLIPFGVAVDSAGNLFISQGNVADVRKVSTDGTITTAFSPSGFVSAVTVDRAGNLYVGGSGCESDYECSLSIRKISPAGDVTLVARSTRGFSLQPGSSVGDGGPASDAQLGFISNLAVDAAGNLLLTDLLGQRIRKIDLNGIITTVGGSGAMGYSGDGGAATNAAMNYPFGLTTDMGGNIYVSDFNQVVRILRPSSQ